MKQSTYRLLVMPWMVALVFASCKNNESKSGEKFEVSGTIKNNTARIIFLEEVQPSTYRQLMMDSATIGSDGTYLLSTKVNGEKLYTLRLGNSVIPFASLINDAAAVQVWADFSNRDEIYKVEGSFLSGKIKELATAYPKRWGLLYQLRREYDSLKKAKAPDSLVSPVNSEGEAAFANLKNDINTHLRESQSPAFSWYLLRNYQNIFTVEEYSAELEKAEKKFPGNEMLTAARNILNRQIADAIEKQKKEKEKEDEKINTEKPNPK